MASISQHSSISQADDVSSPYARVKLPSNHAYDQLRTTEHPYAQVTAVNHGNQSNTVSTGASSAGTSSHNHMNNSVTGTSTNPPTNGEDVSMVDGSSRRGSDESLLGGNNSHEVCCGILVFCTFKILISTNSLRRTFLLRRQSPAECQPAKNYLIWRRQLFSNQIIIISISVAIRRIHQVSIIVTNVFSMSWFFLYFIEGYTSISVREPLANIIAQTNQQNAAHNRRRDLSDSHYATVSDDSGKLFVFVFVNRLFVV